MKIINFLNLKFKFLFLIPYLIWVLFITFYIFNSELINITSSDPRNLVFGYSYFPSKNLILKLCDYVDEIIKNYQFYCDHHARGGTLNEMRIMAIARDIDNNLFYELPILPYDDDKILNIREKESFTNKKINEYASTGSYYFKSGLLADKYIKRIFEKEKFVNDEVYISTPYEEMLNERFDGTTIDESKDGLARELARMNLTLNTYTQWYWKTDLLNLMNFLRLRADHHAQYEIRAYADAMLDTVKKWVPITYEAFMDYRVGGTEVSAKGKNIIQKIMKGEKVSIDNSGLSKREWNELMEAFDLKDRLI